MIEVILLAQAEGLNASWATVIAVATLLLGTSGTSVVAVINWLSNRGKNKGDATKSIVEAAANLLTPYATALEMANNQIKQQAERDRLKEKELRFLRAKNSKLEQRNDELEAKLDEYVQRYGPLTPRHG